MTTPHTETATAQADACDLLFVYGTLRRGSSHHLILQSLHARYLGRGVVSGELFDLGPFPGARPAEAADAQIGSRGVRGELYRLQNPPRDLAVLDQYEGLEPSTLKRSQYRRALTQIRIQSGDAHLAWIYWLSRVPAGASRVPSGDYAKRWHK